MEWNSASWRDFAVMNETLGWALYHQNEPAVTARAETKFHEHIPVGADVIHAEWEKPKLNTAVGRGQRREGTTQTGDLRNSLSVTDQGVGQYPYSTGNPRIRATTARESLEEMNISSSLDGILRRDGRLCQL